MVIGNPPYNGFAGVVGNDDEERSLTTAYRRGATHPGRRRARA